MKIYQQWRIGESKDWEPIIEEEFEKLIKSNWNEEAREGINTFMEREEGARITSFTMLRVQNTENKENATKIVDAIYPKGRALSSQALSGVIRAECPECGEEIRVEIDADGTYDCDCGAEVQLKNIVDVLYGD
jgi:hypothetical protein